MSSALRRVTLPTAKMAETIQFYADVLGLTVFYDQVMTPEPGSQSLLGPEGNKPHRLVSLQQADSEVGMLGLLDYMQPELGVKPFLKQPDGPYPLVIVFVVEDLDSIAAKVRRSGCPIIGEPQQWEIPGKGTGAGMTFLDPNGVLVELTQLPQKDPAMPGPISNLRRVTVPVPSGRMADTIRFYERGFGLHTYYDQVVATDMLGIPGGAKTRIVSLQSGDERFGMVGLLEYLEPQLAVEPLTKKPGYPYEVILVFVVDEMDPVIRKATDLGGKLLARKTYTIPQRGSADGVMLADPNGIVIDLTAWL